MIRINLLPFRAARKKENVRRQLTVFFLSMALLVVAVFAVQWWLSNRVSSLDKKLKQTQAELDKYNKINLEIAEIKQKLENLNKKMAVMAELLAKKAENQTTKLSMWTESPWTTKQWLISWSDWKSVVSSAPSV